MKTTKTLGCIIFLFLSVFLLGGLYIADVVRITNAVRRNELVHIAVDEGCGEICSYNGSVVKSNGPYPQLRKHVNCDVIMRRMANRGQPVVLPPPKEIPAHLLAAYTMNGAMPVKKWYFSTDVDDHQFDVGFAKEAINKAIADIKSGKLLDGYYDKECLHRAVKANAPNIKEKSALVVGTQAPWVESLVLAYGASNVTTSEYRKFKTEHPQMSAFVPYDFADAYLLGKTEKFDFTVSFSSLEHAGLGRYGDPLNPYGDLEAMAQIWCMMKDDGMMILGLPKGIEGDKSALFWNAHREYGVDRLQHVTANWRVIERIMCTDEHQLLILRKVQ